MPCHFSHITPFCVKCIITHTNWWGVREGHSAKHGPTLQVRSSTLGRIAEKRKRPGGLRSRAAVFEESLSLKLEVEEDPQHEGEERERLDEHQTQKHRCADVSRSSRVARDPFASRRSDAALAERSAKRRDGQAEADGQSKRCGINRGLLRSGTLRERRRRDREDGDESLFS